MLLIFFTNGMAVQAQSTSSLGIVAQKIYGNNIDERFGVPLVKSKFGGYWTTTQRIIAANLDTCPGVQLAGDERLVRLDDNLDVVRYYCMKDTASMFANDNITIYNIIEQVNGELLLLYKCPKSSYSLPSGQVYINSDFVLVRLDTMANILSKKEYGGSDRESSYGFMQLPNGNLVFTGVTYSTDGSFLGKPHLDPVNGADYWILLDSTFTELSFTTSPILARGVVVANNLGEIYNSVFPAAVPAYSVREMRRLDALGNVVWGVVMPPDAGIIITPLAGGGVALTYPPRQPQICPNTNPTPSINDALITVYDNAGNVLFHRCYGVPAKREAIGPIVRLPDGSYIIGGASDDTDRPGGMADAWIVKLNAQGDILWERLLGGTDGDGLYQLQLQPNGELLATIYTRSRDDDLAQFNFTGDETTWLVRFASVLSQESTDRNAPVSLIVTPQPDHKYELKITGTGVRYPLQLTLTDAIGRELLTAPIQESRTTIDLSPYAEGVYFIKVQGYRTAKLLR
jgi:hypothetical protein